MACQAVIDLPAGQITRVRLLNLDNTLTYRINIPGVEAQIYALDGNPVEPRPLGKEYWLGPACVFAWRSRPRRRVKSCRCATARCVWAPSFGGQ
jgi:hypothetical protein